MLVDEITLLSGSWYMLLFLVYGIRNKNVFFTYTFKGLHYWFMAQSRPSVHSLTCLLVSVVSSAFPETQSIHAY